MRGAGLWPTGVHEAPWNAAREVPPLLTRVLVRKASRGDARGAGLWPTGVREPLENAADEVPHPLKAGSDAQGARCRRVLEYSRHRGTQRIRFRHSLLAALLYKIEELGLRMHPDLHIDVPDMGLRRVERDTEFVSNEGNRAALGEKEQNVRLAL